MNTRILVVDDEPALRYTLERLLRILGYEAVAVGEAVLAYEVLDLESFDLILLDLHLPQIRGDALYLALIRRWPQLRGRIVLMTGDATAVREDWPAELVDCQVLPKPFTLEVLSRTLQQTLAAARAAEGEQRAEGHG